MIFKIYVMSIHGVGQVISHSENASVIESKDELLMTSFFSAMRSFGRELYQELQYIQFVSSRVVFLPSLDLYVVAIHASNDYDSEELLDFIEDIRDEVNTNFWEDIHKDDFFISSKRVNDVFQPIVIKTINQRGWVLDG